MSTIPEKIIRFINNFFQVLKIPVDERERAEQAKAKRIGKSEQEQRDSSRKKSRDQSNGKGENDCASDSSCTCVTENIVNDN